MGKTNNQINKKISLSLNESLLPILILILLLSFNVYVYGDDAMSGSNQFILLLGGFVGIFLGKIKGLSFSVMVNKIADNLKSVTGAIIILLFVGALSGTWLISGIIPSMIYYGLNILHPSIFLPSCLVICAIISIATGSSWTTSATVGIALIVLAIIKYNERQTPPIVALFAGTMLGALFAVIFQQDILTQLSGSTSLTFEGAYSSIINAITIDTNIESGNNELNDLFSSGGMYGMLNTIWLVISAMVFGGVMESIGALKKITSSLLNLGKSTFSLFASTAGSCMAVNLTTSDQYLAIVIPGKMFEKAFKEKGLAPENLSRTLEDTGTVTSVLIPWNSCGAYQSSVLGVGVLDYLFYAIFNWLSFFMTLIVAGLNYKIRKIDSNSA